MKIQIVDDTSILRLVLKDILVKYCAIDEENVYESDNGLTAIKDYKENQPDIVFLDIAMPEYDGKYVIGEILSYNPNAVVIMCTSSSDKNNIRECSLVGAVDYIIKPPRVDRVKRAMAKAKSIITGLDTSGNLQSPVSTYAPQADMQTKSREKIDEVAKLRREVSELKKEMEDIKETLQIKGITLINRN